MTATEHLCLRDCIDGTAVGKAVVQSCEIDSRFTRVPIDYRRIAEILTEGEVRGEEGSMQLRKRPELRSPGPFGGCQCATRIGKAQGPSQRQSCVGGFAL